MMAARSRRWKRLRIATIILVYLWAGAAIFHANLSPQFGCYEEVHDDGMGGGGDFGELSVRLACSLWHDILDGLAPLEL